MELDQILFKKLYDLFRKRKKDRGYPGSQVRLEDVGSRLTLMARALTGQAIHIAESEREGGWQGDVFYFPKKVDIFAREELNFKLYIFRLFYLVKQKELGLSWKKTEEASIRQLQQKAHESRGQVLGALFGEFALLEELHRELLAAWPEERHPKTGEISRDYTWLYGRWMRHVDSDAANGERLKNVNPRTRALVEKIKAETVIKAKKADEVEVVTVDKKAQEDYVLTHNFEKVETIDEFDGTWRDFDGDDSLQEDMEALQEYNLKHLVRVDDPVHSIYQADFLGQGTVAEAVETESHLFHLLYPEWDYQKQAYKRNYCKLYPQRLPGDDARYYKNTMEQNRSLLMQLRKTFARLNNNWTRVRRQVSGDFIDLDAVTDMFADIRARHTPSEKLYLSQRRRKKELAVLFLLDLSLSSDSYANGNRILDVEKQVSILFGELLNEYDIDFQIDGFYSKTRNNTAYITLKGFRENWQKARLRIGAAEAAGYTRIGTALRHATAILKKNNHRKKWLILLSDGKPNDYDRYEGRYGVEDIKQSIREMRMNGIHNFAFAIEEDARYYLPQMFGENHYNILTSPVELLHALTKLYDRIEHA